MRGLYCYTCCAIAVCHLGLSSAVLADAVADENDARAAVAAWSATRASFPFLKCRFSVTRGAARTEADALAGKWMGNVQTYDVIWVVDSKRVVYRQLANDLDASAAAKAAKAAIANAKAAGRQMAEVPAPPASDAYMTDGEYQLSYSPVMSVANVFSPEMPGRGVDITPFSYNAMGQDESISPPVMLAGVTTGRIYFKPEGRKVIAGVPVVSAAWGKPGQAPHIRYSFDTQRGHLPLQIEMFDDRDGRQMSRTHLTSTRECSRGRQFPERVVDVAFAMKPSDPCAFMEIKVLELDVDNRPSAGEFAVQIPARTQVLNPISMSSYFYTKRDERVHVDDLSKLVEMCKNAKSTPRMDTAIQAPPAKRDWLLWVGGVALGVLLLWAGYLIRNRFVRTAAGA